MVVGVGCEDYNLQGMALPILDLKTTRPSNGLEEVVSMLTADPSLICPLT